MVDENVMTLQPGVEGWQGALSVKCTADVGGVLSAGGRSFYSGVDLREAYMALEVTIASKYLLDEKGSCNGSDQVASLTPHRAADLSDTSVPLAFSRDALRLPPQILCLCIIPALEIYC